MHNHEIVCIVYAQCTANSVISHHSKHMIAIKIIPAITTSPCSTSTPSAWPVTGERMSTVLPPPTSVKITSPSSTLSPAWKRMRSIVPAKGDMTSYFKANLLTPTYFLLDFLILAADGRLAHSQHLCRQGSRFVLVHRHFDELLLHRSCRFL